MEILFYKIICKDLKKIYENLKLKKFLIKVLNNLVSVYQTEEKLCVQKRRFCVDIADIFAFCIHVKKCIY